MTAWLSNNVCLLVKTDNIKSVTETLKDILPGFSKIHKVDFKIARHLMFRGQVFINSVKDWTIIAGWGLPYKCYSLGNIKALAQILSESFGEIHLYICDEGQMCFGWMKYSGNELVRSYVFNYEDENMNLLDNHGNPTDIEKSMSEEFYLPGFEIKGNEYPEEKAVFSVMKNWAFPLEELKETENCNGSVLVTEGRMKDYSIEYINKNKD